MSWSGKGEAGQLTAAEFDGAMSALPPDRLVSGFYLNELLLKLFARHDSHPDVFSCTTRRCGSQGDAEGVRALRVFEKRLLDALGYGLALERDCRFGRPLDALMPIAIGSTRARRGSKASQKASTSFPADAARCRARGFRRSRCVRRGAHAAARRAGSLSGRQRAAHAGDALAR